MTRLLALLLLVPAALPDGGTAARTGSPPDAGVPVPPKAEAVLIGISSPLHGLRTYLVDAYRVDELGEGLAVPRSDGWWFLDARGGHLVVARDGRLAPEDFEDVNDTNCADGHKASFDQTLEFVLPDWVSLTSTHTTSACQSFIETASSWAGTVRLEDANGLRVAGDSGPIEALLGPEAAAALDEVAPLQEPRQCDRFDCEPVRGWLLRPTGVFAVKPGESSSSSEPGYTEVPLESSLLKKLKRPTIWKRVEGLDGDGPVHRVDSPGGGFTLFIGKGGVVVQAGERSIGSIRVGPGEHRVVMEEWVYGERGIARWRKQAAALLERARKRAP